MRAGAIGAAVAATSLGGMLLGAAVVPGLAAAPVASLAASGGPVHPVRGPHGNALHGPTNAIQTSNWSGYAVANYQTNSTYTSASGTWVVPSVTSAPGYTTSYSSSWVGVGGFCENATCTAVDSTLIQLGTSQDATTAGPSYSAWYELLPSGPVTIPLPVAPTDTIVASLSDGTSTPAGSVSALGTHGASVANKPSGTKPGKGGGKGKGGGTGGGGSTGGATSWTLTMTVTTPGGTSRSWNTTVTYSSSLLSAEWIQEAPMGCIGHHCSLLPLANYGTVTFDPGTANGTSPALTATDAIVMGNTNGQTSTPSLPDSDQDGFSACWGNGTNITLTLNSCPVPTS